MVRKHVAILGFAVALLAVPLFVASAVQASNFRSGTSPTVARGEVVDSTVFIAGQNVDVAGEINGDLFCAGSSVTVTGTVHGDVICAGQVVNIRGTVDGDVRVAGQAVTLEAKVAGNVSAAGQTVTLGADATARDVQAAGESITLNGSVLRDADVAGSTVAINGSVGRHAIAAGDRVSLGSGAKIAGDLTYRSHNNLDKASGAAVTGKTRHDIPREEERTEKTGFAAMWAGNWFFALGGFVLTMALVALFPRLFHTVSDQGVQRPVVSAAAGLGAFVAGIVLAIIFALTFIGLPLTFLTVLLWIVLLMLSMPIFSVYLGRMLLAKSTNNVLYYALLGAGIVFVLQFIPILGGLILLVASWMGAGMLVLEVGRHWQQPVYTLKPSRKKA
jgi:cytoskeletal protein CcmA (bactofilin family)